ncbi:MAG: NAD-dependent DNA ligase LigA [Lachnospiraceae bacterium]|nr:NAD-dependent DNA ligase LigA [Lachnospiraceae bacterium]
MDREQITARMKELVGILGDASRAYYQESREIMSNFEYDKLYDELAALEEESGIILAGSPTQKVGYELISELPKERHASPMLSLDKTKDVDALAAFLGDQKGILSWKLDGITVVLTYEGGKLAKAVTRGNGEIGEVITGNARTFVNVPLSIPFTGTLTVRGEAIITYEDFARINAAIPDADARYKNPRNLCAGSVRQLNSEVTAERRVRLVVFTVVSAVEADGTPHDFGNSHEAEFVWAEKMGFETVERKQVTAETLPEAVAEFSEAIAGHAYPSDGLVLLMDDIAYGASLGRTAKFPRNAIAFKWADETALTHLLEIEWSPSRTGLLNPIAVFEPVELEGTTVSRASVHNLSVIRELALGVGDEINVYKANMIIPQIAENLTRSDTLVPPAVCPVCGAPTEIRQANDSQVLLCTNPACPAKQIGAFEHFVGRDAMNIDGLSTAGIEKFVGAGILKTVCDLFRLAEHREEIVGMEGFGEKSFEKLTAAAEAARHTTLPRLLNALGIPGVGEANAKVLARHFDHDMERLIEADEEELSQIDGVGPVLAAQIRGYFADPENLALAEELLSIVEIEAPAETAQAAEEIAGKVFVITGSLEHFENRKALQDAIEDAGGKSTGSVSAKTDYLINNDIASTSSKNKKAKELGIPIITEEEVMRMLGM